MQVKTSHNLKDEDLSDIVAWAQANPDNVRGKTIEEIYKLKTWDEREKTGYEKALSELKQKAKESVETDSTPNTMENFEVRSLQDAMRLAEKELSTRDKREKGV
jgi:hypothetical protein